MKDKISIRQWQQLYANGEFSAPDLTTQRRAGWYDWLCKDSSLAGRLKRLSSLVMAIQDPFILDNYYVWFKNYSLMPGELSDDIRFDLLSGERNGRYFLVTVSSPYEENRYVLYTQRYGADSPEFGTDRGRELIGYINKYLAPQLEKMELSEEELADLDEFETDEEPAGMADFEADEVGETEQNAGEAEIGGPQL